MTPEAWDPIEIEREWSDALALLGELVPTVDEVAESFQSEVFVANVTGDDDRLEALAADAIDAAHQGRETL